MSEAVPLAVAGGWSRVIHILSREVTMMSRWKGGVKAVGMFLLMAVVWLFSGLPAGAQTRDTIPGFAVKVEIQGLPAIFISELTGIGSESEVVEQKIVGLSGQSVVQHVPGRLKWKDIVIKRGLTGDKSFWAWRAMVEAGNLQGALRTFSISFMNATMTQPLARWEGVGGWPSKLVIPTPASASSATLMVEELTISHSGLTRTQ